MPPSNFLRVSQAEIRALTGIRGLAAWWVVLLHLEDQLVACMPAWKAFAPWYHAGHLGVDVFFVLSGFILMHVHGSDFGSGTSWGRFVWLRFARIYPAHLASTLVLVAMAVAAGLRGIRMEGDYRWSSLPWILGLLEVWPGVAAWIGDATWNYPSWSVSAEWFAYLLVFPAGIAWMRAVRLPWWADASVALGLIGLLHAGYVTKVLPWPSALVMVACEFLAGMHLCRAAAGRPRLAVHCGHATLPLIALLAAGFWVDRTGVVRLLTACAIPILLVGLTHIGSPLARLCGSGFLRWLGLVSYSTYLMHAVVQKPVKLALAALDLSAQPWGVRLGAFVAVFAAVLGAAVGLYYLVELPARAWLRGSGQNRKQGFSALP